MKKEEMNKQRVSPFFDSLNCAIEGLIYVVKTQRNMRLHLLLGSVALVAGVLLSLNVVEFILVCLAIFLVLFTEVLNTAIELQIDLVSERYHPLAKIVKDICAGAVLLASVFAILVGYFILVRKLEVPLQIGISKLQISPWNISFFCLMAVVLASILLKIFFNRGTPFYGGMPSAHTAVAFGIWVLVTLLTSSSIVSLLVLVGALMVAQSRVAIGAHSWMEAFAGALIGSLITLTLYQLII